MSCPEIQYIYSIQYIVSLSHLGVGQRGVAMLRVELQGDESDLCGDPGHHRLHRLILGDAHVLECSR